jgi:hypothetical protein
MEKIILILSQLLFSYARTINVIHNSRGLMIPSLVSGTVVKITWLISTYLGVNSLITKDYISVVLYLLAGILGDYLAIKFRKKELKTEKSLCN